MISFDFRSENSRVAQSRSARPRTSVEQHTGLEAVPELHRCAGSLPEASTAPMATATLAATVVMMMNRILMRSSCFGVEFRVRILWEMQ